MKNFEKITALYERLSRDDELQGESSPRIGVELWKHLRIQSPFSIIFRDNAYLYGLSI